MAFALPSTADACRDRMRALLEEARLLAAEVERLTSPHIGEAVLPARMSAVLEAVCQEWLVDPKDVAGLSKPYNVAEARYAAWLLLSEMPGLNHSMIGRAFGGRYGSTVRVGIRKITAWAARDRKLAAKVAACREKLLTRSEEEKR